MLLVTAILLSAQTAIGANAPIIRKDVLSGMALRFEENTGAKNGAKYIARGANFQLNLAPAENWLEWKEPGHGKPARVHTRLIGANDAARMEPSVRLPGTANYFVGSASNWRTDVAGYGRVKNIGIYPGIDLVFHGEQGKLEYDFILAPHADPRTIQFELSGQRDLRIDADGGLVVETSAGEIRWKRPEVFQMVDGKRSIVDGRFVVAKNRMVRFELGAYNKNQELVIDPVLSYLTYLGGKGNDVARGIALDGAGNVYLAGASNSSDLPTVSALQPNFGGMTANFMEGDAFVAKFSPAGALIYLTYIGGTADEGATAIAVDAAGNAYITGLTTSQDFPTVKPLQARFGGMGGNGTIRTGDAFVAKLNPTGNQLIYSTYLGGSLDDIGTSIAIDGTGAAFVTGATLSTNFPVTGNAYQRTMRGAGGEPIKPCCNAPGWDPGDAFVAKLDPTGAQIVFATYVGGAKDDVAFTIALDKSNNVYIGGCTISTDFPTTAGAYQTRFGGSDAQNFFLIKGDGFVTKLNPQGTALVYSTYFGGFGDECVSAIAVDGSGNVYMTGSTSTQNLPVTNTAFQKKYAGYIELPFQIEHMYGDAFVGKLNAAGNAFLYLSFLGGDANDAGMAIAIDGSGNAYVTGFTDSLDFPTSGTPLQARSAGNGGQGNYMEYGDAFLTVVNPSGNAMLYSSYFGGRNDDIGFGIAIDANGVAYLAGNTLSTNLIPTANASQRAYAGTGPPRSGYAKGDAFFAKFSGFSASPPVVNAITNGASNAVQAVSAGMIFVAYGVKMGPDAVMGAALDSNGRLATTVGDSQMLFNERPAPIVYTQANQFAGIVPYSASGQASVQVVSVYQGQRSVPVTVQVAAAAPGLFSANYSGKGQAAAYNQDGTLNSQSNPAAKGSVVVLFGTGEGGLTPPPIDGTIADGLPPWRPINPLKFSVGGAAATVLYANTVPQQVAGLLQINAQLAVNTPSGAQPVVLTAGTIDSQTGLTIWVQ
jgi:uncharacterized protein (TIGR03437 family)